MSALKFSSLISPIDGMVRQTYKNGWQESLEEEKRQDKHELSDFDVLFVTLCEADGKVTNTYEKKLQFYYDYSSHLQPPSTKTIFFLYALL